MAKKIHKVAVTGTKGKTTVVNFIAEILRQYHFSRVLHVNTTGHFMNGVRRSSLDDSKRTWGLVPSVAPGRYLYEFLDRGEEEDVAAVLETSLGCSTLSGMGYAMHNVGIFLNIYEDHIGSSSRINSQEDLVEAKRFVVSRILREGYAVLNADDAYVMTLAPQIPQKRLVHPFFFGLTLMREGLPAEYADAPFVTVREGNIIYSREGEEEETIAALADIVWTFGGAFTPSVYNALAITSGVIASFNGIVPPQLGEKLAATKMDPYGGRLTRLLSESGVEIIADYAHEKRSLTEVARLARTLTKEGGKVIGVVRLAYDRTDELLTETGKTIAPHYDTLVVYDKIDGYWKKANENLQFDRFPQVEGRTSQVLFDAIRTVNPASERIVREDEAIARAAAIARPGDAVVVIVNDNIARSIGFIQESFRARFL
jgi:cyanophycin synthetase